MRISDWSSDVCSSDLMRRRAAVVDALLRHHDLEVEGEGVAHRGAHAAAGGAAGDEQGVGAEVDQVADQRRAEERARVLLPQQPVALHRRDFGDELVTQISSAACRERGGTYL